MPNRSEEEIGEAPAALIANCRLDRAAALHAAGDGNVSDVAYAVGFRSVPPTSPAASALE